MYNGPVKVCAKHSLDKERDEGESCSLIWRGNFEAAELLSSNFQLKFDSHCLHYTFIGLSDRNNMALCNICIYLHASK